MKQKKWWSFINFYYALKGILFLIRTERNALVYTIVSIAIFILGFILHLCFLEWSMMVLAMSLVWMAEAFNTAIELLADEISEEKRERLGKIKDVAAGAVLLVALGALGVGLFIFLPHFFPLFHSSFPIERKSFLQIFSAIFI